MRCMSAARSDNCESVSEICTYSLSIFVKSSFEPASFAVVPNLRTVHENLHRQEEETKDPRDENHVPLSLIQRSLVQTFKVDHLLLDLPTSLRRQFLHWRHAPPCFAETCECR